MALSYSIVVSIYKVWHVVMYSSQLSNFQFLVVVMPSDIESDLAKSLSDLKEELRSGFSFLKRELVEENSLAIKKLRSTALSTPNWRGKGSIWAVWSQLTRPWSRSVGFFVPCGYSASGWKSPRGVKRSVPESVHWELAHIISWLAWEILLRVWIVCRSLSKSVPRPELPAFSKSA